MVADSLSMKFLTASNHPASTIGAITSEAIAQRPLDSYTMKAKAKFSLKHGSIIFS